MGQNSEKFHTRSDAGFNFNNQVQSNGNLAINSRSKSPIGPVTGPGGTTMGPRGMGPHNLSQANILSKETKSN